MKHFTIYHNPRCSKSRQTLDLLKQEGINPKIVLYLEEPPSESDLTKILDFLGIDLSGSLPGIPRIFFSEFLGFLRNSHDFLRIRRNSYDFVQNLRKLTGILRKFLGNPKKS